MPMTCYTPKVFNPVHQSIIDQANGIINSYAAQGYDLTLRQLYYQFVSRDIFPQAWADPATGSTNNVRSYKKLGDIISQARRAGLVDWMAIVDRTRNLRSYSAWSGPDAIVDACADQFTVDLWARQPRRPEVWVEKDALVGVMQQACDPWQVPYFSCRGYTSDSELWAAAQRLLRHVRDGYEPVVYHLGDHDPSGIDMTRDIRDRLELFGGPRLAGRLEVKRIALNMDQVDQYQPPPNPAKETDSRYADYQDNFGDESWELDALEPTTLAGLIRDELEEIIDKDEWKVAEAERDKGRAALKAVGDNWDEVMTALRERGLMEEGE